MSKAGSKRKKLIERGKTVLIIALLISAVLLLNASGYIALPPVRASQESAPNGQISQGSAEPSPASMSVRPMGMVINPAQGKHCAVYYSAQELDPAFESFAAPLAEALGSAASARGITRGQWQNRLLGAGVYFEFYCAQPLSLLSSLLGSAAGEAGGFSSRCLLLSCTDSGVELCFESEADGLFYSCSTGVSASAVLSRTESYSTGSAFFAFTNDKFSGVDQNTVILDTGSEMPAVLSESAIGAVEMDALMTELGMNSYVIRPYTEADGTRVFVESGRTLRAGADGKISFRGVSRGSGQTNASEAVTFAFSLAQRVLGSCCGDAQLCFTGVSEDDGGTCTVRFDYVIDGIAVELPERRAAALVTVSGGETVKLELVPRRYTLTQETRPLLPMLLAASIASSRGDGRISLAYIDAANSAACAWVTD